LNHVSGNDGGNGRLGNECSSRIGNDPSDDAAECLGFDDGGNGRFEDECPW
jgi:hypothetical protein